MSGFADQQARLLVLAKAPAPARVLRRLVPPLTPRQAAALHMRLTADSVRRLAADAPCPARLYAAPDTRSPFLRALARRHRMPLRPQRGNDLGGRMHHALAETLAGAPAALLIGTDVLGLTPGDIRDALAALRSGRDAVFVPVADGGYGLVGLRRPRPELFRDVPWGGGSVMAVTRERCRALGLDWAELPTRWDLDRPADLQRPEAGRLLDRGWRTQAG
ncbi:MAG TPA: TIGR04282 family arsenosugar biosynthesis glycosyltransferase [Gammaproteobacteria bacterium]|nr:TIGR04282 family arsenosugar biosynthesis glycosyltransferase [Gammaproteobacteria bacterium]